MLLMIVPFTIAILVTLPLMRLLGRVLGKRIEALMLKSTPYSDYLQSTPNDTKEVLAPSTPMVVKLDSESVPKEFDIMRHNETKTPFALFRRWCIYDAVGVGSVIIIWIVVFWIEWGNIFVYIGVILTLLSYFLMIFIRFRTYSGEYKDDAIRIPRSPGGILHWFSIGLKTYLNLFIHPRYYFFPYILTFYFFIRVNKWLCEANFCDPSYSLGGILILIIAVVFKNHINKVAQRSINRRLLILRVFGQSKNSILIFGAIRRFWQHIGSTFTIVDRTFIQYKYRGGSQQQVEIVFFTCNIFFVLYYEYFEWSDIILISIFLTKLIISGYLIFLILKYIQAPHMFANNKEQIQMTLDEFMLSPRRGDLTFKNLDMFCFDNSWKDAVEAFVDLADIVLMDLRGYSDQNKGCEIEVDFLFDRFPVGQIVFLVDDKNDVVAVENLIRDRWEYLKLDSPNLIEIYPKVKIYNIQNQMSKDVKGLINVLISCLTQQKHLSQIK